MEQMEHVNRDSIYCDGIESVEQGSLVYTSELLKKVKDRFGVDIPRRVRLEDAGEVAKVLINGIIECSK